MNNESINFTHVVLIIYLQFAFLFEAFDLILLICQLVIFKKRWNPYIVNVNLSLAFSSKDIWLNVARHC